MSWQLIILFFASLIISGCGPAAGSVDEQLISDLAWDIDADYIYNGIDNCPYLANTDQLDMDSDGTGNVCDVTASWKATTVMRLITATN